MRFQSLIITFGAGFLLALNPVQAQSPFENQFFLAPELRAGGSYLGVRLTEVNADRANALKLGEPRGVEVTRVEENSPAENSGLKSGDVLLTYNGENVLGTAQFVRLVQETPQGRRIKIQFWRDGKTQTTSLTTGAPRAQTWVAPPGMVGLDLPDFKNLAIPDIPNPMLVWKISTLGIECEPVDSQLAQYFGVKQGVLVRSVEKGSPSERAGLKAGDVVTAVGERNIATPHDLISFARMQHRSGKSVTVALVRDHKDLTLSIAPYENQE